MSMFYVGMGWVWVSPQNVLRNVVADGLNAWAIFAHVENRTDFFGKYISTFVGTGMAFKRILGMSLWNIVKVGVVVY